MSIAGWRGTEGKVGELAWGATEARDAIFGSLQQTVRRLAADPNVTTWLEPHGEFYQGGDALMGYGPAVDATFREYLKGHICTNVGAPDRMGRQALRSGTIIKAPELAEFAGWGPQALDLSGTWRVGYPQEKAAGPGEAVQRSLATMRRGARSSPLATITRSSSLRKQRCTADRSIVPAGRFKKGERAWIYLWDLNVAWDKPVSIWLNGKKIGESICHHPHAALDDPAKRPLRCGERKQARARPAERIHRLSGLPFDDGAQAVPRPSTRAEHEVGRLRRLARSHAHRDSARRGIEMIREVDPNRQIDLMQPGISADGLKSLAEQLRRELQRHRLHVRPVCADLLPHLMRGSGLPFPLEPGGPADNSREFPALPGSLVHGRRARRGLLHSPRLRLVEPGRPEDV